MRLASFLDNGRATYGADLGGGQLADAGAVLGGRHADLLAVLRAGALDDVAEAIRRAPQLALDAVTFLPPIAPAPRIFCIGLNYHAHRQETGRAEVAHPTVFVRFPSSLVGSGQGIEKPRASDTFDFEGELAVVIGRPGRHIAANRALDHVAGYSCFNDGSMRDFQRHTSQFTAGKNFDRSGAFGPWLVTTDDIPDPAALELHTRVNGREMQHATTDLLIFDVPALVAYLSTFTELRPGDVIATGTPGGVGMARKPPVYLRRGDTVEVEITSLGTLRNEVIDELNP